MDTCLDKGCPDVAHVHIRRGEELADRLTDSLTGPLTGRGHADQWATLRLTLLYERRA